MEKTLTYGEMSLTELYNRCVGEWSEAEFADLIGTDKKLVRDAVLGRESARTKETASLFAKFSADGDITEELLLEALRRETLIKEEQEKETEEKEEVPAKEEQGKKPETKYIYPQTVKKTVDGFIKENGLHPTKLRYMKAFEYWINGTEAEIPMDGQAFGKLIRKIIGIRSAREYSRLTGGFLSEKTIEDYLGGGQTTLPTLERLRFLIEHAENRVTLRDILIQAVERKRDFTFLLSDAQKKDKNFVRWATDTGKYSLNIRANDFQVLVDAASDEYPSFEDFCSENRLDAEKTGRLYERITYLPTPDIIVKLCGSGRAVKPKDFLDAAYPPLVLTEKNTELAREEKTAQDAKVVKTEAEPEKQRPSFNVVIEDKIVQRKKPSSDETLSCSLGYHESDKIKVLLPKSFIEKFPHSSAAATHGNRLVITIELEEQNE